MEVLEFIRECIERPGGATETLGPHLVEVLLPPPIEERMGGRLLLTLALDTDAQALHPDAEMATVGSSFVDGLIRYATERGTASQAFVVVEHLRKKGMREEVERALVFNHCRVRYSDAEPDILYDGYAQFNFRITFLSDERRERLYVLPVGLRTSRIAMDLAERLETLETADRKPLAHSEAPGGSVEAAYERARGILRGLVEEEESRLQERLRKRFAVEASRVSDYYTQLSKDLERRGGRETDGKKSDAIVRKIDAAKSERERKLRELGETYRLKLRARLTSARLLYVPKTFFKVFLDRGQTTRAVTLVYDSVLARLEPPECETCRSEATRLTLSDTGEIVCGSCSKK